MFHLLLSQILHELLLALQFGCRHIQLTLAYGWLGHEGISVGQDSSLDISGLLLLELRVRLKVPLHQITGSGCCWDPVVALANVGLLEIYNRLVEIQIVLQVREHLVFGCC